MDKTNKGEEVKVEIPPVTPPQNVQDVDFDKELENLENNGAPVQPAPKRKTKEEELDQAMHTIKHASKRVKELGGDPSIAIGEEGTPEPTRDIDTSQFVTRQDLASSEARKLARSEGEYKVMMWYITNKGMSVDDAHLLANKNRVKTALSEITRSKEAVPSLGGGGAGQDRPIETEVPDLPPESLQRIKMANMAWNAEQKAYVGKKSMLKFNPISKQWETSLIKAKS